MPVMNAPPCSQPNTTEREDAPEALANLLGDYASKQNLATAFDVSERTIERWVRLRLIPAPVRLGRTSLFHLPTVRQHLEDLATPVSRHARGRRGR